MTKYLTANPIDGVTLVHNLEGNEVICSDITDFYQALKGVVVGVTIACEVDEPDSDMVYKIDDEYGITIKN